MVHIVSLNLLLVSLSYYFETVLCCIGQNGEILINPDGTVVDPITEFLGDGIVTEVFSNNNYLEKGGGPAGSGEELNCNFEGVCCWVSVLAPEDQLDWFLAQGQVDPQKLTQNFGVTSSDSPNGRFLLATNQNRAIEDEARFVSCTIECAEREIQVRLRHWVSSGVNLRVCQQDTFDSDPSTKPLINCQDVPSRSSPGPTSIFLPPGQLLDVVIVASGFDAVDGSVALIDDVTIDFDKCKVGPGPVCSAFCTFEDGTMCQFIDGLRVTELRADTPFEVKEGRFQNRVTGVKGSSQGRFYASAYLYPGETAALETRILNTTEDYVLRLDHYEATFQIYTKIFLENINNREIFTTDPEVTKKDRQWKTASVLIPKETKKVIIMSMNVGSNQGAAALDNIHWLQSTSPIPDNSNIPITCN